MNLTVKENEVYQKLLQGLTHDEIAKRQNVKPSTVKTQVNLVLQKAGVSHRYELMALEIDRLKSLFSDFAEKIDKCIDENQYTYNYVDEDENGKYMGSDTTITSDGLQELRYLIDDLYDEIGKE